MEIKPNGPSDGDLLRRLQEEHQRFGRRLETLGNKPYLSEEEQLEEVRLKKLKLRLKDQMAGMRSLSSDAMRAT